MSTSEPAPPERPVASAPVTHPASLTFSERVRLIDELHAIRERAEDIAHSLRALAKRTTPDV